ncbi:hypothetical protein GCM10027562_37130 [Arthrobacter pigmenti]
MSVVAGAAETDVPQDSFHPWTGGIDPGKSNVASMRAPTFKGPLRAMWQSQTPTSRPKYWASGR